MAELCPETAFSGRIWSAHSGLGKKPNEIEAFGIPVCNTRCYTCPSDVAIAHLTFQFTLIKDSTSDSVAVKAKADNCS